MLTRGFWGGTDSNAQHQINPNPNEDNREILNIDVVNNPNFFELGEDKSMAWSTPLTSQLLKSKSQFLIYPFLLTLW